ncbi:MAG: decaprenyl-phosphate phosphoribosyltransferase, partial [Ignavibacteria bacterium]
SVIICYALYTVSARTVAEFHTERLIYTTFFVIFGIFRYIYLVYKKSMGENAVEVLVKDKPLIINILLYVATVILIIYFS